MSGLLCAMMLTSSKRILAQINVYSINSRLLTTDQLMMTFVIISAFHLPNSKILLIFQHLTKGTDSGSDSVKVGHGQFQIDERHRDTRPFEMID